MTESSTKKKPGAKKKVVAKETKGTRRAKGTGARKAAKQTKKPAKKKPTTKTSSAARTKTPARKKAETKPKAAATPRKKGAPAKKATISIKELLLRTYDTGAVKKKGAGGPYKKKPGAKFPPAPPFISGRSKKQVEQARALLFKAFDLKAEPPAKKKASKEAVKPKPIPKKKTSAKTSKTAARKKAATKAIKPKPTAKKKSTEKISKTAAKAKAPGKKKTPAKPKTATRPGKKAAPARKPRVSIRELPLRTYDTGAGKNKAAAGPYKKKPAIKIPPAPRFFEGSSEEETSKVTALLLKGFDLEAKTMVQPTEEMPRKKNAACAAAPQPIISAKPPSPAGHGAKLCLAGLAILMAIIVAASFSNRNSFFLKNVGNTVEVWRGRFAPTGSELMLSLKGMDVTNPLQEHYSKQEVYKLLFGHFQKKADTLLYDPAGPDFRQINKHLLDASTYAPSAADRTAAERRLESISFLVLLHKIDVALIKGTLPDLQRAFADLEQATAMPSRDYERQLLATRIAVLKTAIKRWGKR